MKRIVATVLACAVSSAANAHTGIDHSATFLSGLAHPFDGIDHIATMVTVGVWSALAGALVAATGVALLIK